jgi:hypothetical protein
VREIVIVISDLYFPQGQPDSSPSRAKSRSGNPPGPSQGQPDTRLNASAIGALPGIEHITRFGAHTALATDWRPWLAHWLGRDDLATVAPAVIAAAGLVDGASADLASATSGPGSFSDPRATSAAPPSAAVLRSDTSVASPSVTALRPDAAVASPSVAALQPDAAAVPPLGATAWIATPVHLIAGLTSLHLDRRSILRLSRADLESLAADFNHTFGDSDLQLTPLPAGDFLMRGPATLIAATTEPARAVAGDLDASLPKGNDARPLKRLGAELEMWLHASPLNETRRRRGELPVSTLWLWGGTPSSIAGATPTPAGGVPASTSSSNTRTGGTHTDSTHTDSTHTDLAFGNDSYLTGLWRAHGDRSRALPDRFADLPADPHAQRAVFVLEVTSMLHLNPNWTVLEVLADLDRRFVSPALAALGEGDLETIVLLANDTQWRVRRRDRLKLWRRAHPGMTGLQRHG